MTTDTEVQEYEGSCHCAQFKFKLLIPKLTTVWTCNCSICSRNGYLWIFPVPEKSFVIHSGTEKSLHAYEFAMRGTRHLFCTECGSSVLARRREAAPGESLRINARMLEGIDLTTLKVKPFSGAEAGSNLDLPQRPSTENVSKGEIAKGNAPKEDAAEGQELKVYHANCHCGAVKWSIKIPELKSVNQCNCSHCIKKGQLALILFSSLSIDKGKDVLKTYQFGRETIKHNFCPNCGSYCFGERDSQPKFSLNARMFKDVDVDSLVKNPFDGATLLGDKYVAPSVPDFKGEVEEGLKVYKGSCHCAAVTYALKSKPLEETNVVSCNCSLCSRRSDLFIYPPSTSVQLHGAENLTEYFFVSSMHCFCKICGTSVSVRQLGEGNNETPINVRTIIGVDLPSLKYYHYNGKAAGKPYEIPE